MKKFYETELGKIASYTVHETVNAYALIGSCVSLMEKQFKNNDAEQAEYYRIIRDAAKKANAAIDYMYSKLKEYELGEKETQSQ